MAVVTKLGLPNDRAEGCIKNVLKEKEDKKEAKWNR